MEVDRLLTLEEFDALADDGSHAELWRGRLQLGRGLDDADGRILSRVAALVDADRTAAGTGRMVRGLRFLLSEDPPTVLSPALAFVTRDHLRLDDGRHIKGAPELVVEVATSAEHAEELHDRALDYLEAGSRVVWVVEPTERRVTSYDSRGSVAVREHGDQLDADVLLPGLLVPVADLFSDR